MKREQKFDWKEYPDPEPVEIPTELKRPETIDERLKRIISGQMSQQAMERGQESFEEADDFDVEDDFDKVNFTSEYEMKEMEVEIPVAENEKLEEIEEKLKDSLKKTDEEGSENPEAEKEIENTVPS